MSLPVIKNKAGDTETILVTVYEPDGTTPTNLTGARVKWCLVPVAASAAAELGPRLLERDSDSGGVTFPVAGKFQVNLAKGATGTVRAVQPNGQFLHEAEVTLASGQSFTGQAPFTVGPAANPD